MAIIWMFGFDDYEDVADADDDPIVQRDGSGVGFSTTLGRFGGGCITMGSTNQQFEFHQGGLDHTEVYLSYSWFFPNTASSWGNDQVLMAMPRLVKQVT